MAPAAAEAVRRWVHIETTADGGNEPAIGATSRLFVPAVYLNCSQDLMHHQINLGGPESIP